MAELDIPEEYRKTISGSDFFTRIDVEDDCILLFTTVENLRHLSHSKCWLMDGTFKTVPRIFRQLYSIHGRIGEGEECRIIPLVYALMTSKSQILYSNLFKFLSDMADEENILLEPEVVITDFELASINAIKDEYPDVRNQGCLFHLCQSIYRKIQEKGLASRYGTDEEFSLLMRKIPALAFLPSDQIPDSFNQIRVQFPEESKEILDWFDEYYVNGRINNRLRNSQRRIGRIPPLFAPEMWSVYENNRIGLPRTQNSVEAFHRKWGVLVGDFHVGIYKIIRDIRKEQNETEIQTEKLIRGIPGERRTKNSDIIRETTLQNIINSRNQRTLDGFIRALAHRMLL